MKKKYGESEIFRNKLDVVALLLELKNKYDSKYINSNLYHRQIALGLDTSFSVNFKHPSGLYKLIKENGKYSFYANPIFMLYLNPDLECYYDDRTVNDIVVNIKYNSSIKTCTFYSTINLNHVFYGYDPTLKVCHNHHYIQNFMYINVH